MKETESDKNKLRAQLIKKEAKSLMQAYPDFPKDSDGNIISEKKSNELITPIAGAGNIDNKPIKDVNRLKAQYGGETKDWTKLASEPRDRRDGVSRVPKNDEYHSYKNITTGKVYEVKHVDTNKRAIEQREKAIEDADKTKKNKEAMSTKSEILSQMKNSAKEITTKAEVLKKNAEVKKEEFNKRNPDFAVNRGDILGHAGTEKKAPDKPKAELKPEPPKPDKTKTEIKPEPPKPDKPKR